MGGPADAILAGIPAIQRAQENRGAGYRAIAEGVGELGKGLGKIGLLLKQKKVEDDYAKVDSAFQAAMLTDPENAPKTMSSILSTIQTAEGRRYFSDKIGKTYGLKSDLLDLELKKIKVEREKGAPKRSALLKRAYDGDTTALTEGAALGDDKFQENLQQAASAGALLKRSNADQAMQERKDKETQAEKAAATKALADAATMLKEDPSLAGKGTELLVRLINAGNDPLSATAGLTKLGVAFALDKSAATAGAKDAEAQDLDIIRAAPIEDILSGKVKPSTKAGDTLAARREATYYKEQHRKTTISQAEERINQANRALDQADQRLKMAKTDKDRADAERERDNARADASLALRLASTEGDIRFSAEDLSPETRQAYENVKRRMAGGGGPAPESDEALAERYKATPEGPEKVRLWNEIQTRRANRGNK